MWTLGANAVSDEGDDEEARATWPTPPPEMEEPTSGVELAHRLVRLRAGDRSREVIVDEAIDAALAATGIDGIRRAETLSLPEFAALARALPASPAPVEQDPLDLADPSEFED